jgi:hypothetical protein
MEDVCSYKRPSDTTRALSRKCVAHLFGEEDSLTTKVRRDGYMAQGYVTGFTGIAFPSVPKR